MAQICGLGLSVFGGGKTGFAFWPLFKDFACGRARMKSVPEMPSFIGNSSVDWRCGGQSIPLPCPPVLLLPSVPVAPAEAPTLVAGAIVFESWAVVISESVVITIGNADRKWGLTPGCN